MPEEPQPQYIGLDISSTQLDYCVSDTEEGSWENNPQGRHQLIARLKPMARPRVVCEASGGYEKLVAAELLASGVEVCVVQPGRVRAFAYAEGLMAKTDRLDARLLRRYGEKITPRLAQPIDEAAAILRELLEHRRQLVEQLSEVDGRLTLAGPTLRKLLIKQQTFLKRQIDRVERMIRDHIDQDPTLREKSERLQQMQGVGPVLSATLLAYVPELGCIESAKISSLIGVAPFPKDSGKTQAPRHVRAGRWQVRNVLYMAAVCASRSNPVLSVFYQRLRMRGKPAMVCLIAVMRKMLCVLNRMLQKPDFTLAH
jgi:transposase